MERKEFIKKSCTFCLAIGAGLSIIELSACAHLPVFKAEVKDNKIAVPLSMFASSNLQIISSKNLEYSIAIRKEKNNTYTALLMQCTHADNQLSSTGSGFVCSLHGSTFDKDGIVTQGPAERPLRHYPTLLTDSDIIITIN